MICHQHRGLYEGLMYGGPSASTVTCTGTSGRSRHAVTAAGSSSPTLARCPSLTAARWSPRPRQRVLDKGRKVVMRSLREASAHLHPAGALLRAPHLQPLPFRLLRVCGPAVTGAFAAT